MADVSSLNELTSRVEDFRRRDLGSGFGHLHLVPLLELLLDGLGRLLWSNRQGPSETKWSKPDVYTEALVKAYSEFRNAPTEAKA